MGTVKEEIKVTCEECIHKDVCKDRKDNTNPTDCEQFIAKSFVAQGMTVARMSAQFAWDVKQMLHLDMSDPEPEEKAEEPCDQ